MAVSRKSEQDLLRNEWVNTLFQILEEKGEDVMLTASNKIAFPAVGCEGNEDFIVLTVSVPKGGRDGEPYDGYGEAEAYRLKVTERAEKAKAKAEAKAKKIAKAKANG